MKLMFIDLLFAQIGEHIAFAESGWDFIEGNKIYTYTNVFNGSCSFRKQTCMTHIVQAFKRRKISTLITLDSLLDTKSLPRLVSYHTQKVPIYNIAYNS